MADGDNGQKPEGQPEMIRLPSGAVVPRAELEQLIGMQAAQVVSDLRDLYPLLDPKVIETVALGTSRDQINIQQILDGLNDTSRNGIALTVVKPSKLMPEHGQKIEFLTTKRMEHCETVDEALKTATICALLYCPTARALLSLHGYNIKFTIGTVVRKADMPKG